jgi:hypothetical protein
VYRRLSSVLLDRPCSFLGSAVRKLPECERRFLIAAAKDDVTLVPAPNHEWIGTRGPFGLATQSGPLFDTVLEMATALDGYLDVMRSPRRTKRADFDLIHELTGTGLPPVCLTPDL